MKGGNYMKLFQLQGDLKIELAHFCCDNREQKVHRHYIKNSHIYFFI